MKGGCCCSFELSLSNGWESLGEGVQVTWKALLYATQDILNYLPLVCLEGHYIYVEGDNVVEGDVAHVLSPTCQSPKPLCFRFWYYIFGAASLMSLRVYVVLEGGKPRLVWIASGRKANRWLPGNVTIHETGKLQVRTCCPDTKVRRQWKARPPSQKASCSQSVPNRGI